MRALLLSLLLVLLPPVRGARAAEETPRRPVWRPLLEVQLGFLYGTRRLEADGAEALPRQGASGLWLQAVVYPMAALERVPLPLAGLGFRVAAGVPLWLPVPATTQAGEPRAVYQVSEQQLEVGYLRWHYNFRRRLLAPDLELEALYGYRRFVIEDPERLEVLPVPPAEYHYLGLSAGAHVNLTHRFSVRAAVTVAGLLSLGPLGEPAAPEDDPVRAGRAYHVYGPGQALLWRVEGGAAVRIWQGVTVGLNASIEQLHLFLDGTGDLRRRP